MVWLGTPLECLEQHFNLCLMRLKVIGVPWGDMKGVEDSDAEQNVAPLEISVPLPLGCCCLPPLFTLPTNNNIKCTF